MTGKGTYTWANGNTYTGEWVSNDKYGKGTYTWANGNKQTGYYVDGEYMGTVEKWEKDKEIARANKNKYAKIYSACILDKSSDVDMQVKEIQKSVKKVCSLIAEKPSFIENWKYN